MRSNKKTSLSIRFFQLIEVKLDSIIPAPSSRKNVEHGIRDMASPDMASGTWHPGHGIRDMASGRGQCRRVIKSDRTDNIFEAQG